MTIVVKAPMRMLRELRLKGEVAVPRKARRQHRCAECGDLTEKGSYHYAVYYGKGLASLKFPDRVHIECVGGRMNRQ